MAPVKKRDEARPLGGLVNRAIDPVLQKRAGLIADLTASWPQIVGADLARVSRIVRIRWQTPRDPLDGAEPATLVIAATGMNALRLQHMTGEIIERTNSFFGYRAIGRIKLEQRVVALLAAGAPGPRRAPAEPDRDSARKVHYKASRIKDPALREAIEALGRRIAARKNAPSRK